MATTTISPATPAQLHFIESLLDTRAVDPVELDVIRTTIPTLSKTTASRMIDMLKAKPTKPVTAAAPTSELQTKLASVPKSKYAIPVEELEFLELDSAASIHGDLLFLEVREYMHTLYMRRLTGSVGAFTRHKLTKNDTIALVELIARDAYKYTKLFGLHYSCCGKCGAELTDPVSREFQLGPDCRKVFGF